jgi:hypothetical protein
VGASRPAEALAAADRLGCRYPQTPAQSTAVVAQNLFSIGSRLLDERMFAGGPSIMEQAIAAFTEIETVSTSGSSTA